MKKKGFTLIELIVVIAIIGVLAAILVPAMLGFVRKAKIQAANATAAEVIKAFNAVVADDAQNDSFTALGNGKYSLNINVGTALETVSNDENVILADCLVDYSNSLANETFVLYAKDGVAVASAAKNGKYYGTFPAFLTGKNYNTQMTTNTIEFALNLAAKKTSALDEIVAEENNASGGNNDEADN